MDAAKKKPTPQISPRHCKECGQLTESEHCECPITWIAKLDGQVVSEQVARHPAPCPMCSKRALTGLPSWELAKQTDGTNIVCNPGLGGCNHGFEVAL